MNKIIIYFLLLAGDDAVLEKEESSPPPPSSERQTGRRTGRKERTGSTAGTGGTGGRGGTGGTAGTGGTGRRTGSEASARTPSSQIRYYIHTFQRSRAIVSSMSFTSFSWGGGGGPNHRVPTPPFLYA
jgi:hypothetical protein